MDEGDNGPGASGEQGVRLRAGSYCRLRGLSKKIYNPRIQKLGLIVAGFMVYLHPHRVQILGNTEISYLRQLKPEERERLLRNSADRRLSALS